MDSEVLTAKLETLRRCLQRVRDKTPAHLEGLLEDLDLQDIISVNLQRAVQTCVDIGAHIISESEEERPATLGETFDALARMDVIPVDLATRLKGAVGFRNIAVHAYRKIDWEIVYAIVTTRIDDFTQFARCINSRLSS